MMWFYFRKPLCECQSTFSIIVYQSTFVDTALVLYHMKLCRCRPANDFGECMGHLNRTEWGKYLLVVAEFIPLCIWHSQFAQEDPQNTQEEEEIYLKYKKTFITDA